MRNLIGTHIEHYQILVRIRETPTRILYRVYDARGQNFRAMEVVKAPGTEPAELLRLINEQTRKNTELVHPNIATISDTGLSDGLIYIVYNFAPTQPFRRVFNRTYQWREMTRELVSVTHALAYAHEKGVIHGWLHPSSIVLDEKRNPMLFDFGFEQLITDYLLAYTPGTWINRWGFEYRAPEQLSGTIPDAQTDIYAIGMMLNEWLTGKIPLLDPTVLGTFQLRRSTRSAIDKTSSIPPVIQNLIQRCLARNPADRYQSMQEVYIVLARGALDMSITQKMVRKPLEIPIQHFNWRRWSAPLNLTVLIVLALIFLLASLVLYPQAMAAISPSVTPTSSRIPATPTRVIQPTATPTVVAASPTPTAVPLAFPVFQGTDLGPAVKRTLSTENINQMLMLSSWGIGDVNRLAASPDGKQVAAASSIGLFVFDAKSLKLEHYVDTLSSITAMDFSPDSQTLATGDSEGLIQLWNTQTWQEAESPYSGHTKAILDLAFSPNGTKLASASLDNSLMQWTLNSTQSQTPMRETLVNGLNAVAYSGDSRHLVTGGNDFQIRVWDADTLTVLKTTPSSGKILDIAGIPGSNRFVIGGNNQEVELLDLTGEDSLTTDVGSLSYPLTGVAVSPTGKMVAASNIKGGVVAWDISGMTPKQLWATRNNFVSGLANLDAPGSRHSLAFSRDGNLIFSGLYEGTIRSIDAKTGKDVQQNQSLNVHVNKLAISHNSQYLLAQREGQVTLWDLWKGAPLRQWTGEIIGSDPFSHDDRKLALVVNRTKVQVYDPANGTDLFTFESNRAVKAMQFIRNDTELVIFDNAVARLWSMVSGEELKTTRRYEGTGCATVYDLNQEPVVSITRYDHVVANEKNSPILCNFSPLDWAVGINEEHGLIAFGGSSKLSILGLPNSGGQLQDMHSVNRKTILKVALSPDGALLAAAFDDYTIHVWDVATQEELGGELYGHSDVITDLRFSPDGRLLISASRDGTIHLWGVPY